MTPGPNEAELASIGLTLADVAADYECEVWPDCAVSINVFVCMLTQWRMGPAGPIGLDYNVLPMVFQMTSTAQADQPQVFSDLRVLEDEALKTVRKSNGG